MASHPKTGRPELSPPLSDLRLPGAGKTPVVRSEEAQFLKLDPIVLDPALTLIANLCPEEGGKTSLTFTFKVAQDLCVSCDLSFDRKGHSFTSDLISFVPDEVSKGKRFPPSIAARAGLPSDVLLKQIFSSPTTREIKDINTLRDSAVDEGSEQRVREIDKAERLKVERRYVIGKEQLDELLRFHQQHPLDVAYISVLFNPDTEKVKPRAFSYAVLKERENLHLVTLCENM